jgi:hypothetical protein
MKQDVSRARAFMERGMFIDIAMRAKLRRLDELKAAAIGLQSSRFDPVRVQNGRRNSAEDALIEYLDYSREIQNELVTLARVRREIVDVIDAVPDRRYKVLLRTVYLRGQELNVKAKKMLAEALEEVEKILNERGDAK